MVETESIENIRKWKRIENDLDALRDEHNSWLDEAGEYKIENYFSYGAPRPEDGESWIVNILSGDNVFLPFAYQHEKDYPYGHIVYIRAVSNICDDCWDTGILKFFQTIAQKADKTITNLSSEEDVRKYFDIIASCVGWGKLYEGSFLGEGQKYQFTKVIWKNYIVSGLGVENPYIKLAGI